MLTLPRRRRAGARRRSGSTWRLTIQDPESADSLLGLRDLL